jgi:hypothetical protein
MPGRQGDAEMPDNKSKDNDFQTDSLDRDILEHDSYAEAKFRIYIGRQEYFDRLYEQA